MGGGWLTDRECLRSQRPVGVLVTLRPWAVYLWSCVPTCYCRAVNQPCTSDADCATGLFCEVGASDTCVYPSSRFMPCHATKPCTSGYECQEGVWRCYTANGRWGWGTGRRAGRQGRSLCFLCGSHALPACAFSAHARPWRRLRATLSALTAPRAALRAWLFRAPGDICVNSDGTTVGCQDGFVCDSDSTRQCLTPGK